MIVNIHSHDNAKSENSYPTVLNINFDEAESIYNSDENGFYSIGFHPWDANEFTPEKFQILTKWANDSRTIFIGECGLDKKNSTSYQQQHFVFIQQILLSEKIKKPMIIHCVGYYNELFEIKRQLNPLQLWIIHGFRGKPQLALQALKLGIALSFGEHFNIGAVKVTPVDKLFVETDESNMNIEDIYNQLSSIKLCKPEELYAGSFLLNLRIEQI